MTEWQLAIDVGSTSTRAVVVADGRVEVLALDGSPRMPSLVVLGDDGELVVGRAAAAQALWAPTRADPSPARSLGKVRHLVLGGRPVPVVDAVAAVLSGVAAEGARRRGGSPPSALALTHPARWAEPRLDALAGAARAAGLPDPVLVPSPVAVARGHGPLPAGQLVAVYDLGGSFDVSVLRSTGDGFELAGQPGGGTHLGGAVFDDLLYRRVGAVLAETDPEVWERLQTDESRTWRHRAAELRRDVRAAKEALSTATQHTLYVAAADREVRLTRAELEDLVRPAVEETVEELVATVRRAGVEPGELAAVYLSGGSSQLPLVTRLLADAAGRVPRSSDDPGAAAALGAASALPVTVEPVADPEPEPEVEVPAAAPVAGGPARPPRRPGRVRVGRWEVGRPSIVTVAALLAIGGLVGWSLLRDDGGGDEPREAAPAPGEFDCAVDPSGAAPDQSVGLLWRASIGDEVVSRPVSVAGSVVAAALDGHVVAIDAATGDSRWDVQAGPGVRGDLDASSDLDLLVVPGGDGGLRGLRPASGEEVWSVDLGSALGSVTIEDDTVYVGLEDGGVAAVDAESGDERWRAETEGAVFARPVVDDDAVFAAGTGGTVHAFDVRSGDERETYDAGGPVEGGVAVTDGVVIVGTTDGRVRALEVDGGDERWSVDVPEGRGVYAPIVVQDETAYVAGADCGVRAVTVSDGEEAWVFGTRGSVDVAPDVDGNLLVVGSDDGFVYGLGRSRGVERWELDVGGPPSAPVAKDGTTYFGTAGGELVAVARR